MNYKTIGIVLTQILLNLSAFSQIAETAHPDFLLFHVSAGPSFALRDAKKANELGKFGNGYQLNFAAERIIGKDLSIGLAFQRLEQKVTNDPLMFYVGTVMNNIPNVKEIENKNNFDLIVYKYMGSFAVLSHWKRGFITYKLNAGIGRLYYRYLANCFQPDSVQGRLLEKGTAYLYSGNSRTVFMAVPEVEINYRIFTAPSCEGFVSLGANYTFQKVAVEIKEASDRSAFGQIIPPASTIGKVRGNISFLAIHAGLTCALKKPAHIKITE